METRVINNNHRDNAHSFLQCFSDTPINSCDPSTTSTVSSIATRSTTKLPLKFSTWNLLSTSTCVISLHLPDCPCYAATFQSRYWYFPLTCNFGFFLRVLSQVTYQHLCTIYDENNKTCLNLHRRYSTYYYGYLPTRSTLHTAIDMWHPSAIQFLRAFCTK